MASQRSLTWLLALLPFSIFNKNIYKYKCMASQRSLTWLLALLPFSIFNINIYKHKCMVCLSNYVEHLINLNSNFASADEQH